MTNYPGSQKASSGRQAARQVPPQPKTNVLGLIALGFVCGYIFAWFFSPQLITDWLRIHLGTNPGIERSDVELAALPKPHFEFYTLLTQEKKKPIKPVSQKLALPASTLQKAPDVREKQDKQASQYVLQLASFQRREDAEHMLVELVMHGFEANIRTTKQQGGAWYRVVMGPFVSRGQAEQAQGSVAKREHISGIIRRMES